MAAMAPCSPPPHSSVDEGGGKILSLEEVLLASLHTNLLELVPGSKREPGNVARRGIRRG